MSFMMQLAWVQDVWMDYVLYLSSMMEMSIADTRDASKTSTFKTKALIKEHLPHRHVEVGHCRLSQNVAPLDKNILQLRCKTKHGSIATIQNYRTQQSNWVVISTRIMSRTSEYEEPALPSCLEIS